MKHNILLCQELVSQYTHANISPWCTMKIDFHKAYDSMALSFVRDAMLGLGFPRLYVDWIMMCVGSLAYSVVDNGELKGYFEGRRGLRQGDPLSPFLFVICIEIMSRVLGTVENEHAFVYHPKCLKMKLTHVCFADDLMFFCRGDEESLACLNAKLEVFLAMSGLSVNLHKSEVFLAGVKRELTGRIVQQVGMVRGTLLVRYLGVPLHGRSLHMPEYNGLVVKMV